jgi:hypothetical protein
MTWWSSKPVARAPRPLATSVSVSRQLDGDPRARWVLLNRDQNSWHVEHKHTGYDVEAATRWALEFCPQGEREAAHLRLGKAPD